MISGPVTNRYADALFELARDKGHLDAISRDVEFLSAEMEVPSVADFLFDGRIAVKEKQKRIEFLQAHIHPLTYSFVRLLLDKNRLEVLRGLGTAFRRRQFAEQGVVEGVVESARPLEPAALADLEGALSKMLAKSVKLETKVVPELLGGVRVTVDHRMLDQSLRGRLEGLRTNLMSAQLSVGSSTEAAAD